MNASQAVRQAAIRVRPRRWWALSCLALALLVIGLDTTVVVTALPTLSQQLGASTSELQWVLNAYTLVLAGLILPAGVLGDRLGRRRVMLFGLVVFGGGSVVAAWANNVGQLIALRALIGVGGAAIVPLAFSILPSLFSVRERPRAVAVLAATVFLGLPLGPLAAGWLLTRYMWGSIFLINVPVVAMAVLGIALLVPESKSTAPGPLDWLAALLSVFGVTALVYGIVEQPENGWGDARVVTGLVLGVVLLSTFVGWELRSTAPMVDLGLFHSKRFSWATLAFVGVGFSLSGVLFTITPFLQIVQGYDAQATGVRLLPMILGIMAGAAPSDRLTARLGSKLVITGGLLVAGLGDVLLAGMATNSGFGPIATAQVVLGVGIGVAMAPATDAILGALPRAELGAGMALPRTLQFVGMSFGVAVLGSILNSNYRRGLGGHLAGLPAAASAAVRESVTAAAAAPPHVLDAARVAYASGMSDTMLVSAGVLAAVAVLVALLLPARPPA